MGYEGELGIPKVISDAIEFLLENGLKEEGLFRRSPSSHLIKMAKEAYNSKNSNITVQTLNSVHLAAVLLKTFVRELPNPIFPSEFYPEFKKINCNYFYILSIFLNFINIYIYLLKKNNLLLYLD